MFSVTPVPIFNDNYVFVLYEETRKAIVVDPGASREVLQKLEADQLDLAAVLITHCHSDHIDGLVGLVNQYPLAQIYGPAELARWTNLKFFELKNYDQIVVQGLHFNIYHLPGHTQDHLAYYAARIGALFCGDVLFGLGCGRLFEGSPEQGYESLQKIKTLPPDTSIYCAHEYTEKNMNFIRQLITGNTIELSFLRRFDMGLFEAHCENIVKKRRGREPTVPLALSLEMALNPFLNCSDSAEFALLRTMRNQF